MFSHILIPADGSPSADSAVKRAIKLAKEMNAGVTGLHVAEPFRAFDQDGKGVPERRAHHEKLAKAYAEKILDGLESDAKTAGVAAFDRAFAVSDEPHAAIIATARDRGCDLIVMASHGRRGLQALVLGSETHKVLLHSKIPVLVYR